MEAYAEVLRLFSLRDPNSQELFGGKQNVIEEYCWGAPTIPWPCTLVGSIEIETEIVITFTFHEPPSN